MKWMILLALMACTSQAPKPGSETTPPEATSVPGESDAKPVSPYSVEPCYCMKIFEPVCAGGKSYGNSCEAECQGHKTWTKGSCP